MIAIYHLETKVISRGSGRSAVAAAAYMSCSSMTNDYDGITHDYTHKQGLVWEQIFLPKQAPKEWKDRAVLWNAVEAAEKTKDSRLARELIVALPAETDQYQWQVILTDFIEHNFVNRGMCADVCIHDTDGHNPHAHILLTVRPLTDKGKWQPKTQKEYLCVKDGHEAIGLTSAEYKALSGDGWEKQYLYQTEDGKEWLPPSFAEYCGYKRVSKYPKCTMYGRQNPISADWNSEETLQKWRENWAKTVNRTLEPDKHIDHRSYKERGIHKQPTVHVGIPVWKLTAGVIRSERKELNRLIHLDNQAVDEWVKAIETLMCVVFLALSKLVDAVATAWEDMLVCQYCADQCKRRHTFLEQYEREARARLPQMDETEKQIQEKETEADLVQKKISAPFHFPKKKAEMETKLLDLNAEIAELKKRQADLLNVFRADEVHSADELRAKLEKRKPIIERLAVEQKRAEDNLQKTIRAYEKLKLDAKNYDPSEYGKALADVRPKHEQSAREKIKKLFGKLNENDFERAKVDAMKVVGEWEEPEDTVKEECPAEVSHRTMARQSSIPRQNKQRREER